MKVAFNEHLYVNAEGQTRDGNLDTILVNMASDEITDLDKLLLHNYVVGMFGLPDEYCIPDAVYTDDLAAVTLVASLTDISLAPVTSIGGKQLDTTMFQAIGKDHADQPLSAIASTPRQAALILLVCVLSDAVLFLLRPRNNVFN